VALFYYVGHGQIDNEDQLCLALTESRAEPNRRAATSLLFSAVRRALLDSDAATRIVILDCCFAALANRPASTLAAASGAALETLPSEVLDKTSGTGAYTMAASSPYTTAWYEADPSVRLPQTYFTKYLIDLIEQGIPGQPSGLKLHPLFTKLRDNLATDQRPVPESRSVDGARDFVFARNAAPPESHYDPELELLRLQKLLAETQARNAEAEARIQVLSIEAAERAADLELLQQQARQMQLMTEQQQRELRNAVQAAGHNLEEAIAAQEAAIAAYPRADLKTGASAHPTAPTQDDSVGSLPDQASPATGPDALGRDNPVTGMPEEPVTSATSWPDSAPDIPTVIPPGSALPQLACAGPDHPRGWAGPGEPVPVIAAPQENRAAASKTSSQEPDDFTAPDHRRLPIAALVLVLFALLTGGGLVVGYQVVHSQYYVGSDNGNVAIFRGIHDNVLGISLFSKYQATSIPVSGIPAAVAQEVSRADTGSLVMAQQFVANIRQQYDICQAAYAALRDWEAHRPGPISVRARVHGKEVLRIEYPKYRPKPVIPPYCPSAPSSP
jgi:hypothetical protein